MLGVTEDDVLEDQDIIPITNPREDHGISSGFCWYIVVSPKQIKSMKQKHHIYHTLHISSSPENAAVFPFPLHRFVSYFITYEIGLGISTVSL